MGQRRQEVRLCRPRTNGHGHAAAGDRAPGGAAANQRPGCVARYTERRTTPLEHREEIKAEGGLREFAETEDEFAARVHARAWNTGDGPKTIFADGVKWLRENAVLLPGVTTAEGLPR